MIVFRVDSSYSIGTGHVIRCLHMAKILRDLNHPVSFVCRDLSGNIISQISSKGFPVHSLSESQDDIQIIKSLNPRWVIVDHYGISEDWQNRLASSMKIFVIDDLMNRKHNCDVLLDQNYRRDFTPYKKLIPTRARLLAGPQYCLMPENLEKSAVPMSLSSKPKILSFFGGSDSTGELLKFARSLIDNKFPLSVSLVALDSHQHLDELKKLPVPSHFSLQVNPPDWHGLLKQHDFYIGSGGTVTWERLILGLPGAVIAVAENQEIPSKDLAEDGYQLYWGRAKDINYSELSRLILETLSRPQKLEDFSKKGLGLVNKFCPSLASDIFGSGQP